MAYVIKIPKLGLTMTEGTVFKWYKKEGDEVKAGDVLFEISTDKLVNEVTAEEDGVLRKIILNEGETAGVGAPVGIIAKADEDIAYLLESGDTKFYDSYLKEEPQNNELINDRKMARKDGYVPATPYAKKIAKENNIDLKLVAGSGKNGIVLAKDVQQFIDKNKSSVKASPMAKKLAEEMGVDLTSIDKDGRIMKEDVLRASLKREGVSRERTATPSRIRRIIAERMLDSSQTTAPVTYIMEVDVTELKILRDKLNKHYESKGIKFSYNHLLMKALAKALMEYPELNASFDGETIVYHDYVNMGVAVAIGKELIVPNIKNVHYKTLEEIALETEALIRAAREGKLEADDLSGGTFTITNLGSFGMDSFTPIINKPEVAILGINTIKDKPVVFEGEITVRTMTNINLTADHRLVDGALAAIFLNRVKELLENPYLILA